jgi:lipopolysaccharide export system protein LptA
MANLRVRYILLLLVFSILPCCLFANKPISFSADKMSGAAGKKNESTSLRGNAVVTVGTLQISGDLIELTGKDYRYVTATGNVQGVDSEKGYSFSADTLVYDRDSEVAAFQGNAKLLDTKHDVDASAGLINYNQKTEIAYLQIGVRLKRKEIDCTAGFALYRRSISMLDLTGSPLVVRSGDEFRADRISVNLETEYIILDGTVSGTLKDAKKDEKTEVVSGMPAGEGASENLPPGAAPPSEGTIPSPSAETTQDEVTNQ